MVATRPAVRRNPLIAGLPTLFTPHEYRGKRFVDGGLVNPIPIAPTLIDETHNTIAVSLAGKPDAKFDALPLVRINHATNLDARRRIAQFIEGLHHMFGSPESQDMGMFHIIAQSIDTMQSSISQSKLAAHSPDIVIEIPVNACIFFEFHRARELREIGRRSTARALAVSTNRKVSRRTQGQWSWR